MPNRVTGLSGMDIEGMVSSLMKPETAKVDKLYKQKTLLLWKQEAYLTMSSQMSSFQKKFLDIANSFSFKSSSTFLKKNFSIMAGSSESSGISVKNTTLTKDVNHKITVDKLAQKQKLIGYGNNSGYAKKMVSGEITDFSDLREGSSISLTLDGKQETVTLDKTIVDTLKDPATTDKLSKLATYLNTNFQAKFGTGINGTSKVQIGTDGNRLSFSTEAGRTLSVSSFNNNYTSSMSFNYDSSTISDTLSFRITAGGNEYDIGVSTLIDTGELDDDDQPIYRKRTAEELAKAINDKINEKGINGEPGADGKYANNFSVTASGNTIKFSGNSISQNYKVIETTTAAPGRTGLMMSTKTNPSVTFDYPSTAADTISFEIAGKAADGTEQKYNIFVGTTKQDGVKLSAEELAKAINDAIKKSEQDEQYTSNVSVSATSAGKIKFEGKSLTQTFIAAPGPTEMADPENPDEIITVGGLGNGTPTASVFTEFELYGKKTSAIGVTTGLSTEDTSNKTVASVLGANADLTAITINGKSFASMGITSDMKLDKMIAKINSETNVNLSYNALAGSFTMESKEMGKDNGFELSESALKAFGFDSVYEKDDTTGNLLRGADNKLILRTDAESKKLYSVAQDAEFWIDGAKTSRTSNDITIGDLKLTLNKEDPLTEITIKSASDTDTLIKNIKEFVDSYNTLLKSFTGAYGEKRAKTGSYSYYEPLTDEEKAAMSDKDIDLWEAKAKQGLLARDATVGRVADSLRNAMSSTVELANGKKISLAQIGIASTDWKDMGQLSIDENKLRTALEERPEDVMEMFTRESSERYYGDRQKRFAGNGIAFRVDDVIQDATRTKPHPGIDRPTYGWFTELVGSANIKTQDNDMVLRLKDINTRIWDLEQSNLLKENNYYTMFSKMEAAMTKAQNQSQQAGLYSGA